jgi:hypothetical protein
MAPSRLELFEFFLSAAKLTKLDVEEAGTSEARGMMTTVWRPKVRIPVPKVDDEVEAGVEVPEEELLTVKGTKRKRGPYTKGPCEHGVKHRSKLQGVQRLSARSSALSCKECGGVHILRARSSALYSARSAVGLEYASTVVSALSARSAVVHQSASTVVSAIMQGVRWVIILRARSSCALSARSAVGHQYASTVVSAHIARSAVGHKSAITIVNALSARSAAGAQSASTVVYVLCARSAVVHQSASTVASALHARSVAPQRLERIHSSARTPNVVQRIFLQLPIYRTDPRAVVSPPPPDPSSAAA